MLQERHFPTSLRHAKTAVALKQHNVTFADFFTSTTKI